MRQGEGLVGQAVTGSGRVQRAIARAALVLSLSAAAMIAAAHIFPAGAWAEAVDVMTPMAQVAIDRSLISPHLVSTRNGVGAAVGSDPSTGGR